MTPSKDFCFSLATSLPIDPVGLICDCDAGKRCLELGCGSGLLGVILARLQAHAVLTDGSTSTLENCMHNLAINRFTSRMLTRQQASTAISQVRHERALCERRCACTSDILPAICLLICLLLLC